MPATSPSFPSSASAQGGTTAAGSSGTSSASAGSTGAITAGMTAAGSGGSGATGLPGTGGRGALGSSGSAAAAGAAAGAGGASSGAGGGAGTAIAGASGRSGMGGSAAAAGAGGTAGGTAGASAGMTPVYRLPLRIHMAMSQLTNADLAPILDELNAIWLAQAGVCFEIEVTNDETNRTDGFDFRYTSGQIPGAPSANGLTQNAHSIWSVDHPNLGPAPHPVMNPTARTTAHELGHALGLAHENPPPSSDCSSPCYCVTLNLNCDDFLLRSGTKGFFLSDPEIQIARGRAARNALSDMTPTSCGAPVYNR